MHLLLLHVGDLVFWLLIFHHIVCCRALFSNSASYSDAFCAKVYLEHFLCDWDSLDKDMIQVAVYLRENMNDVYRDKEPCVQPFRAFAYPLPHELFKELTIKIVNQERDRIPSKSLFKLRCATDTMLCQHPFQSSFGHAYHFFHTLTLDS